MIKFSVITVCFNSEKTIERTIKSVLSQSYKNFEYIVVDGRSSDQTTQIIDRYESSIDVYISEEDQGLYDAMNKGITKSSGDYICILNSDDVYANENILERVSQNLSSQELDILMSDISFFRYENEKKLLTRKVKSRWFKKSLLSWGWMPPHPGMFISRKLINKVGFYDTSYSIASDFDYVLRLFSQKNLKHKHLNFTSVHMLEGGISTSGIKSNLLITKEMNEICKKHSFDSNYFKLILRLPIKLFLRFFPDVF